MWKNGEKIPNKNWKLIKWKIENKLKVRILLYWTKDFLKNNKKNNGKIAKKIKENEKKKSRKKIINEKFFENP